MTHNKNCHYYDPLQGKTHSVDCPPCTCSPEQEEGWEKDFEKECLISGGYLDHEGGDTVKNFISSLLDKQSLSERRIYVKVYKELTQQHEAKMREMVEKMVGEENNKNHFCPFNDGESNCDCYHAHRTHVISVAKEYGYLPDNK